jgi:mutator protein MutT
VELDIAAGMLYGQGRLLLGKRSARREAYPGVWDLPGGHVEAGETAEQALARELREELGVTPTEWREWAVLRAPAMGDADAGDGMFRLHVSLVTQWEGEPRNLLSTEHDEVAWFTLDDAAHLALAHAEYPRLFREAVEGAQ